MVLPRHFPEINGLPIAQSFAEYIDACLKTAHYTTRCQPAVDGVTIGVTLR